MSNIKKERRSVARTLNSFRSLYKWMTGAINMNAGIQGLQKPAPLYRKRKRSSLKYPARLILFLLHVQGTLASHSCWTGKPKSHHMLQHSQVCWNLSFFGKIFIICTQLVYKSIDSWTRKKLCRGLHTQLDILNLYRISKIAF